ncbi:MAG TPA: hypothetical protein PKK61_00095 [Defluviitaleaceae bacterium]|nr:hypothetical protein [Defluviitaleaceae bacterium]HQD92554.1 hypothetical protein [Bacilli bacterium]
MRFLLYKKTISKLSASFIFSFIVSRFLLEPNIFFVFAISSFGALYLLLGWLQYLKNDGINLIKPRTIQRFKKFFSFLDRFKYKNKGVNNIYKDDLTYEINEDNEKVSIYSYLISGIILLVSSQILPKFL